MQLADVYTFARALYEAAYEIVEARGRDHLFRPANRWHEIGQLVIATVLDASRVGMTPELDRDHIDAVIAVMQVVATRASLDLDTRRIDIPESWLHVLAQLFVITMQMPVPPPAPRSVNYPIQAAAAAIVADAAKRAQLSCAACLRGLCVHDGILDDGSVPHTCGQPT